MPIKGDMLTPTAQGASKTVKHQKNYRIVTLIKSSYPV